jgi:hypothetical protein
LVVAALVHVLPRRAAFSSPEKLTGRFGGRDFLCDELGLWFHDDMLVWQGKYYGDFEIATAFPAIAG